MTAASYVAIIALAWLVLIAAIVAFFHGARWVDRAVDDELNQVFSVRAGALGPAERGVQREE